MTDRLRIKTALIDAFGNACLLCGHSGSPGVFHFHHVDPAEKHRDISACRSFRSAAQEARKCTMLCANCHSEVEWGMVSLLPRSLPQGVIDALSEIEKRGYNTTQKPVTADDVDKVAELVRSGMGYKSVAKEMGWSRERARHHVRRSRMMAGQEA